MLIAQATVEIGLTEMLEWWHALVAILSPVLLGLVTNENARKAVKKALPVVTATGVTAITAFVNSDLGAEVLVILPIIAAAIHYAYQAYGLVVSLIKSGDLSLNDILGSAGLIK